VQKHYDGGGVRLVAVSRGNADAQRAGSLGSGFFEGMISLGVSFGIELSRAGRHRGPERETFALALLCNDL